MAKKEKSQNEGKTYDKGKLGKICKKSDAKKTTQAKSKKTQNYPLRNPMECCGRTYTTYLPAYWHLRTMESV